jgi:hypothetical protein
MNTPKVVSLLGLAICLVGLPMVIERSLVIKEVQALLASEKFRGKTTETVEVKSAIRLASLAIGHKKDRSVGGLMVLAGLALLLPSGAVVLLRRKGAGQKRSGRDAGEKAT